MKESRMKLLATEEQFKSYEKVRQSGIHNMIMEAAEVMLKMKLNPRHKSDIDVYFDIIKNYQEYSDRCNS